MKGRQSTEKEQSPDMQYLCWMTSDESVKAHWAEWKQKVMGLKCSGLRFATELFGTQVTNHAARSAKNARNSRRNLRQTHHHVE